MPPCSEEIYQLNDHPDAETLRDFDHPPHSLKGWCAVLTAKAWIGEDLACFFADLEHGEERFVLIFRALNAYRAGVFDTDMRLSQIGSTYQMDVFVTAHFRPIIDRIDRMPAFVPASRRSTAGQ